MSCTCLGNVYTDNKGNIQYLTEYMCLEIIANNPNCCDIFNETCLDQVYFNSKSENYIGCYECPSKNSVCCENIQAVANNLNPNKNSKCCSLFDEYCAESYEILKKQKGTECYDSTAIKEFYKENYSNNEYTCNYSDEKLNLCIQELSCSDINDPACLEQLNKKILNKTSNCKCSCAYKFPRESCMAEIIHAKSECCHTWTAECDEIFNNLSKDTLSGCSVVTSQNETQQLITEIDCGCVYTEPTINNVSCCFKDLCTVFNEYYGSSFNCNTVSPSELIHYLIANTNLYDTCSVDPIVDSSCPNQDCPSSPFFDPINGPPCIISLFFDPTVYPLCTAANCYHGPDCRIWPYGAIEGCNRKTNLLPTVNSNGLCQRDTSDNTDYYDCAVGIANQINSLLQTFGGYTTDCVTVEYILDLAKRYINVGNPVKASTPQECCKICTQNGQPPSDIILPSCNNNYNSTWSSPPDLQQNPSVVYENRVINFNVEGSAGLFTTAFGLTKFNSSSNFNLIDVTDSSLTKSIDISDGSGTVSWTFRNRAGTQGDRSFKGILYGACNAEPIYVTPKIILTDTPPSATFNITATNTNIYESQSPNQTTVNISGSNIFASTNLYWRISGTVNVNDFIGLSSLEGQVTLTQASTTSSFILTANPDQSTETSETFVVILYSDAARTQEVSRTSTITINDDSTTPIPPTAVLNHPSSVREGETIQIIVDTTNLQVPANLTYVVEGPAGQLDNYSGQISIGTNGQGLITLTALNDFESPENDSFVVKVYSSLVTEPIGTSSPISIIDVPIDPVFTVEVNENSIYFGDTLTFTVTAENIGRSYSMIYKIIDTPLFGSLTGTEFNPEGLTGSFEIIYDGTPSAITTFDIQVKENLQTAFSFILAIAQEETPDDYEDLTNPISAGDIDVICNSPLACPKSNTIFIEGTTTEGEPILCPYCEQWCYSGAGDPECDDGNGDPYKCCTLCDIFALPGTGCNFITTICPDECTVDPGEPYPCRACDDNCGYVSYAGGKDHFIAYVSTPWFLFVPASQIPEEVDCGIPGSISCEGEPTIVCKVQYGYAAASYGRFSIKQFITVKENGVWKNRKMTEEEMTEYINQSIPARMAYTQSHGEAWRSREPCNTDGVNYYGPSTVNGSFNQADHLNRESGIANCKGWYFNENAEPGEIAWGINEYSPAYEVGPSQIRLHSMGLYNVEQETDPTVSDIYIIENIEGGAKEDNVPGAYVILPPVERISELDQFGNLSCTSPLNEEFLRCENYKYIYGAEIPEGNTLLRNLYDYPQRQVTFETDECCNFIQACLDTSLGLCVEQDADCIRRMTKSCEERAFKFCITGGCTLTSETSGNYDNFVYYFQGLSSYYTPDSEWPATQGTTQTRCFTYNSGGETIYDFSQFSSYLTTDLLFGEYVQNSAPPQTTGICYKRVGYNDVTGNDQFTCSKIMSIAAGKLGTNEDRKAIFDYIQRTVNIYFNDTILLGDEFKFINQDYMTQCICNYLEYEDKTDLFPPEGFPYPEAPYYAKNGSTRFSSCYALDNWKSQVRELPSGSVITITNLGAQCPDNPDIKWTVSFSDPLYPSKPAQSVRCPTSSELPQLVSLPKPKYYPSYWQDRSDIELTFTFNLNAIFGGGQNTNVRPDHHCGANFRDIPGYEKYRYTPNFSVTAPCYPCKGFTNYPMYDAYGEVAYAVSDLVNKLDNNVLEFLSYTRSGIYSDGSAIPGANTATKTPREANAFVAQANVHQPLGQLVARMTLQEQIRQSKIFHENVCQFILMLLCSGVEVLHIAELTELYHYNHWLDIPGVTYNKNRESIKDVYGGRLGRTNDDLSTFPLTPDGYEGYYGAIRDGGSININGTNFNQNDGSSVYLNVWERGIQPNEFAPGFGLLPWTSADDRGTSGYPTQVLVGTKGKSSGLNPRFNSEIGIIRRHKGISLPDAGIDLPLCRPPVDTWNDAGTDRTERGKCNLPNNLVFGGFCWITNVIDRPLWNKMKEINQLFVDSGGFNPYEALKLNIPNLDSQNISIPDGMQSSDFDGFDAWVNWPDRQGNGSNNLAGFGLNNIEVEFRLFQLLELAIKSFIYPDLAPGDDDIVETYLNSIYANIHIEEELYIKTDNRGNRNYTINDLKAGSESTGFRWLTETVNGQEKYKPSYSGSQYDNASACYIEEVPPDINDQAYSRYLEACEEFVSLGFAIQCDTFTNFMDGVARNHTSFTSTLCAAQEADCPCTDPDVFTGCDCGFCQALSTSDTVIDLPITVETTKQCNDPPDFTVIPYDVVITVDCISKSIAAAINIVKPDTTNAFAIASIINKLIAGGKTACVFKYNNKTYRQMRRGKDLI